jgi:putative oxidoreductase
MPPAAAAVHAPHGFFSEAGGLELPASLGMVAASIAVMGPGRLSLDHVIGHCLNRTWMVPSALATAAAAATVVIGARQRRIRAARADTDNADNTNNAD